VRETLREHGEPIAAGAMTFMQARTANEVVKAQERRVRLQRMKGELVDRAKAVAQVFRLARDERDAWVNWPARVAAIMAAELEVDQRGDDSGRQAELRGMTKEAADDGGRALYAGLRGLSRRCALRRRSHRARGKRYGRSSNERYFSRRHLCRRPAGTRGRPA
jgi:hypothetical protein